MGAVAHHLGDPAHAGDHRRPAQGHGLDQDVAEALVVRAQGKHIRLRDELPRVGLKAKERDGISQAAQVFQRMNLRLAREPNRAMRIKRSFVALRCAPKGRDHLVGASPTRAMVGWPGSWQAAWPGNRLGRSPATKAALGGRAKRRAVTRVKPEQASKGKLWTPTRPEYGEGSTVWGSSRRMHPERSTGVMGIARRDRGSRKRGRPAYGEGRGLNGAARHRPVRESDRVVVLPRPGNAGGGKGPDFWCVFQANEVR